MQSPIDKSATMYMESHGFSCYVGVTVFAMAVIALASLMQLPCLLLVQSFPNYTQITCDHPYEVNAPQPASIPFHSSELMPGYVFSDQIADMIKSGCRKTIIILSPNYIESEWCSYEARLALHQSPGGCIWHS